MLGVLLFFPFRTDGGPESDVDLALALFNEGRWEAARIEVRRLESPTPAHRLMQSVCGLRLGEDRTSDLVSLRDATNAPPAVAAMAAYELGQWHWMRRADEPAFDNFTFAFTHAAGSSLFLRSSYALSRLLREHPDWRDRVPGLHVQVRSCYAEWTRDIRETTLPDRGDGRPVTSRPALWLIALYQSQIAPAIGQRCSLDPSCSSYASQALRRHGLVGLALFADRGVREPDVVAARTDPVVRNGVWRYRDRLDDHDYWFPSRAAKGHAGSPP